jgi:small subunit ribosomal protein S17
MSRLVNGVVSSISGKQTIVVTVSRRKTHPLYHKQYTVSQRFMVHDEKNSAQIGDRVAIVETRPLSARKHFKLDHIVEKPILRDSDLEIS